MKLDNIRISKSERCDSAGIFKLLEESRGDNLTEEERAKQGFIQGKMSEEMITQFQDDLGVFVAKDDDDIVGVAFASRAGLVKQGPPLLLVETLFKERVDLTTENLFLYGPVVVRADYKGKGILTRLLTFLCSELHHEFKNGTAFVEEVNQLSLNIHRHYFEKDVTSFMYDNRKYYIFLLDPKTLLQKYKLP